MSEYPIFLRLAGEKVLIIGGGIVGLRKTRGLLAANARVTVISPTFHPEFATLPTVSLIYQSYYAGWLNAPGQPQWRLVFVATNNPVVNAQASDDARHANIFCCRCDDRFAGDFVGAATATNGPLTLALGTGGASPVISTKLVRDLIANIPREVVDHAALMQRWRSIILEQIPQAERRHDLLRRLASAEVLDVVKRGGSVAGENVFFNLLAEAQAQKAERGTGPPLVPATAKTNERRVQD